MTACASGDPFAREPSFLHRVEELHLVQSSLLPGEAFAWTLPADRAAWWCARLAEHAAGDPPAPPPADLPVDVSFAVTLEGARVQLRIQIELGADPEDLRISIKGDIHRDAQARWQGTVDDLLAAHGSADANPYPLYEVLINYLLPVLHAEYDSPARISPSTVSQSPPRSASERWHALFTSHHLVSTTKRRNLQQWTSSLRLSGFAKVGHPGVIYCTGAQDDVEEFVENVKAMQWLALRLRFVEVLQEEGASEEQRWLEFEKVGEVVEEMRRLGREQYVTEMGIGSAGGRPD